MDVPKKTFLYPWMAIAPALGFVGPIAVIALSKTTREGLMFIFSALGLAGIIMTAGFSLFPFVLTSSTNPAMSLTIWDSTSSYLTLGIMTIVAGIFVPTILGYTTWCFYKMWGRMTSEQIKQESHTLY